MEVSLDNLIEEGDIVWYSVVAAFLRDGWAENSLINYDYSPKWSE